MPQINTSLTQSTIDELKNIAENEKKSFSKVVNEIIELGLKIHKVQQGKTNKKQEKLQELEQKHSEYLLRILTTCNEILLKVYGEKSMYKSDNPETITKMITGNIQKYIEGFTGKEP